MSRDDKHGRDKPPFKPAPKKDTGERGAFGDLYDKAFKPAPAAGQAKPKPAANADKASLEDAPSIRDLTPPPATKPASVSAPASPAPKPEAPGAPGATGAPGTPGAPDAAPSVQEPAAKTAATPKPAATTPTTPTTSPPRPKTRSISASAMMTGGEPSSQRPAAPARDDASPDPYQKLPGELSPTVFAAVALVMSVLIHAAIAMWLGKLPLGAMRTLDQPQAQQASYRISRPISPQYLDNPALLDTGEPAQIEQPSLAALSRHLLLNPDGAAMGIDADASADVPAAVTHDDQRVPASDDAAASARPADLPLEAVNRLAGGAAVELPSVAGGQTPQVDGPGDDPPSAADAAQRVLTDAVIEIELPPLAAPGPTGRASGAGLPADADDAPPQRPAHDPLAHHQPSLAPIDVAAVTIQESQRLTIPEKLDDDFTYELSKFHPMVGGGGLFSSAKPDQHQYFKVQITPRRSLRKLSTIPKDVVFLIDTSGSVPQDWVNNIVAGVRSALGSLNDDDRFNIVFFSEKPSFFSEDRIVAVNAGNLAKAQQYLTGARSAGDTDVNRAMTRLLQRDLSAQRAYYLILISDGLPTRGVMNNRELINLITRDNDLAASIYCIGVGNTQNKELLNFLAYRNKGLCLFSTYPQHAASQIRGLLSRIRYPLIKDVSLNLVGLPMSDVFPHHLPNIHQGESFALYGRYEKPSQFTMRLSGHNGVKSLDFTFGGDLTDASVGAESIPDEWAFWKLHHLYSEIIRRGQTAELQAQIDELKKRFKLKTLY